MKKALSLVLVIVLVVSLCACTYMSNSEVDPQMKEQIVSLLVKEGSWWHWPKEEGDVKYNFFFYEENSRVEQVIQYVPGGSTVSQFRTYTIEGNYIILSESYTMNDTEYMGAQIRIRYDFNGSELKLYEYVDATNEIELLPIKYLL